MKRIRTEKTRFGIIKGGGLLIRGPTGRKEAPKQRQPHKDKDQITCLHFSNFSSFLVSSTQGNLFHRSKTGPSNAHICSVGIKHKGKTSMPLPW